MGILNDQFKSMTPAQKTYVLSILINKIYKSPTDYGLSEDGVLRIGDKLNFSKLFENGEEVKSVFAKAKETIIEGSSQEKNILENNEKIAAWVDKNPNTRLTNDKVAEILNTKIEASPTLDVGQKIPEPEIVPETSPKITESINTEPKLSVADLPETKTAIQNQLEKEIEDAKQRLATLTSSERKTEQSIDYENIKRAEGGLRSFGSDTEFLKALETNFRNEIDYIYGERGLFGLKKIEGVNTKEWGFIRGLDANKVLNYFRDPENSDLSPKVLVELGQSEKHRALMEHLDGLLNSAGGGVKPFENGETMEAFIKRLGSFLMRKSR